MLPRRARTLHQHQQRAHERRVSECARGARRAAVAGGAPGEGAAATTPGGGAARGGGGGWRGLRAGKARRVREEHTLPARAIILQIGGSQRVRADARDVISCAILTWGHGGGNAREIRARRPRGRGRRDLASVNERKQIDDTECSVRGRWESRPTNVTRSRHAAYHVFEPQRSQIGQRGAFGSGATAANGSKKRVINGSKSEYLPTRT